MRISHIIYRLPRKYFLQIIKFYRLYGYRYWMVSRCRHIQSSSFRGIFCPFSSKDIKFSYCRYILFRRKKTNLPDRNNVAHGYFFTSCQPLPWLKLPEATGVSFVNFGLSFFRWVSGTVTRSFISKIGLSKPVTVTSRGPFKSRTIISFSLLKPASRHIECLLGTDFPKNVPSHDRLPTHTIPFPHDSILKKYRHLVQGKGSTVIGRHRLVVFLYPRKQKNSYPDNSCQPQSHSLPEVIDSPVLQCFYIFCHWQSSTFSMYPYGRG